MKNEKKYFEVVAKCGHVGRKFYVPVKFAVVAESGKEAAKKAREFPRVKHDHKDAILSVNQIDYERFLEIEEINNSDPYLKCQSTQEQRLITNLFERLKEDFHNQEKEHDKEERLSRVAYKMKKNKIIEKLFWEDDYYEYCY